jgi:2-oxoglutarate ferredoxin oxidoreductase subunit beta
MMHDGSSIVLKNTEKDYDPTNRAQALQMLEEARANNQMLTGLIYLDENKPILSDQYNLIDKPLNRLNEQEMRPKPESIKMINDLMF